ncbi:hypothetical protein BgiMline_004093 [Biomphalaria glabrata]|nr:interferon-induced protein with tetratricopeptide repeats 5-like [Biomphalaria glabrata]KAI8796463.1 interferon-induced protein with tetratricopeptide repeats 5 [Biomphalaria glabrata]
MEFNPDVQLKTFPCTFNLKPGHVVTRHRYSFIRDKEIEELKQDGVTDDEKIRSLNLLTWVLFCLHEKRKAFEKNSEVLEMTNRKNITALGNLVYMSSIQGDRIKGSQYCKELQDLAKGEIEFDNLKVKAIAEQAYTYCKLGGIDNYQLSIDLYKKCIETYPRNFAWKYGLGLLHRRLINHNVHCSSQDIVIVDEHVQESARLLLEVAENGDGRLKGYAYAQLAQSRMYNDGTSYDAIFRNLSVMQLVENALEHGGENPTVLTMCGMSLSKIDNDMAIKLLKKSSEIREISMTYHHLGLSLLKKLDLNNASETDTSDERFLDREDSLSSFVKCNPTKLSKEDALVKEAIICFKNAIKISHEQNVTARVCLGNTYMRLNLFQKALKQYTIIMDRVGSDYFVSLITAHEKSGLCLLKLSQESNGADSESLKKNAKEQFLKALTLAADLATRHPEYKNCATTVWESFHCLLKEVEQIPTQQQRYNEKIKLLELAKNKDIVHFIKEMFQNGLELDDIEVFKTVLRSLLRKEEHEDALAFLKIAGTNPSFTTKESWTSEEVLALRCSTYLETAKSRLFKSKEDCRLAFKYMFELKYAPCVKMNNCEDGRIQAPELDVLVVHDDSSNSEDGLDVTAILAHNLRYVFKRIYGLDNTFINLERNVTYCDTKEELLLNEMKNYRLVVLIIGDNDAYSHTHMLKSVPKTHEQSDFKPKTKVLVIRTDDIQNESFPQILHSYSCLHLSDDPWKQTKLLTTSVLKVGENTDTLSIAGFVETIFNGNFGAVMTLFDFLEE